MAQSASGVKPTKSARNILSEEPVLKSWLWKRIPRVSDSDKKSLRRMAMTRLVKKQTFQKRWFEFRPADNVICYHKEQPLSEEELVHVQGRIEIGSIVDILTVSPDNVKQSIHEREETPTPHVFDIYCVGRVYTMCAPTEEMKTEWVETLTAALTEERRKKKRLNDLQQKAGIDQSGETSEKVKALAMNQNGSIENQSKAVNRYRDEESREMLWTGNLPKSTLSLYSERPLESQAFFRKLVDCCSQDVNDPISYVRAKFESCRYKWCREGDKITSTFNYECPVDYVYFIIEGEIVRQKDIVGEELPLSTLDTGDWIGPSEIHACDKWITDYVVESKCVLLCMPAEEFRALIVDPAVETKLKETLDKEVRELIQQVLTAMPLFEDVETWALEESAKLFELQYYEPNETLVTENGVSEEFFIMIAGAGNITKMQADGTDNILFTARAGDYFGELGLLKNQPRQATVKSHAGTVVIMANKQGFNRLLDMGGERVQERIQEQVGQQMHRFISKIDLFANIEEVYSDIARVMTFRQFPPFKELCKQGTIPDGFYAVVSGVLELTLEYVGGEHTDDTEGPLLPGQEPERIDLSEKGGGPLVVGAINEQETFGEVSILYRNVVATETVRTRTHTVMLFIARNDFQELLTLCPELKTRLELRYKMGKEAEMKQQKTIEAIMRHYARLSRGLARNTTVGMRALSISSLAASGTPPTPATPRRSSLGDEVVTEAEAAFDVAGLQELSTRASVA